MVNLEALVLFAKNWGEADKMLTLFTAERGKIRAVAYGARRAKSTLLTAQMYSVIDADLSEGERLYTLRQARLKKRHKKLSEDFAVFGYGAFVSECVANLWPENVPDEAVYRLLLEIFAAFEDHSPRFTALAAAWQLLSYTGYEPRIEECSVCGKNITTDGYWSVEAGGAVCKNCRKAETIPYPLDLMRFIITLRDLDWKSPPSTLKGSLAMPAENILLRHLRKIMGKPMKSLSFINQTT